MFGHQPQQPVPITGSLSSLTISFQFHLNRLPANLPSNSNVSTSNAYSGILGGNMLDRLLTYLYIFDVATETNAAISRDKNGKDIISTFKAVISGFSGEKPFSVTFADVTTLHQWLKVNHVIPNIHDGKAVIDKDGVKGADVLENHSEYQRYIATHAAHELLTALEKRVNTLNSDKRELERQIQRLTNQVNQMEKARQDQIESDRRIRSARFSSGFNGFE